MRKFKCGSGEEPDTRCQIGPGQTKTVTPAKRFPSQMHSSHQLCFPVLGVFWGTPLSDRFCTVKPTPSEGTWYLRVLEPCEKEAWPHLQRHSTPGFLLLPTWTVCVFNYVPFPATHLVVAGNKHWCLMLPESLRSPPFHLQPCNDPEEAVALRF